MRRLAANALIFVITAAVMAGLFEVACRTVANTGMQYDIEMWKYAVALKRIAADPAIGHEHVPGTAAHLMGVDVAINSRGLRDREIPLAKPMETKRVLMLGDSIVFGWGVKADQTIPANLERDLTASGFGPTQVINTGVGNYNSAMEVEYFLKSGVDYQPDIVVLNYFINDAERTPTYHPVPWFARHFYAYAVVGGAWDTLKRLALGGPDWKDYYAGLYRDGLPGWVAAQDAIKQLAEYCRDHGIRLVLANIPELHQTKDYPFAAVNAKIAAVAAANHVEYLDLLPAVSDSNASTLWVTAPDPHPNAKADALMARALADYLLAPPVSASEAGKTQSAPDKLAK